MPVPLVHRVLRPTQLTQWDNGLSGSLPSPIIRVAFVAIPPSASCGILRFGIWNMDAGNSVDTYRPVYRVDKSVNHSETKLSTPFMAPLNAPPIAGFIDTPTLPKYQPHRSRYL